MCIDKYEASVWSQPDGGTQYGVTEDDYPCGDNGQDCFEMIYARSVAGVQPSTFITWFQAAAALANSGKRLPHNIEWQQAGFGLGAQQTNTRIPGAPIRGGDFASDGEAGPFSILVLEPSQSTSLQVFGFRGAR